MTESEAQISVQRVMEDLDLEGDFWKYLLLSLQSVRQKGLCSYLGVMTPFVTPLSAHVVV